MSTLPHCQVFVAELEWDREQQSFYASHRPVTKIDVLGTVTYVSIRENAHIIHVDDGTGILQCVQFHPSIQSLPLPGVKIQNLPPTLANLVESVVIQRRKYVPKLGDCINIRGKLNIFRDQPQLIINQLREVRDSNEGWFRALLVASAKDRLTSRLTYQ